MIAAHNIGTLTTVVISNINIIVLIAGTMKARDICSLRKKLIRFIIKKENKPGHKNSRGLSLNIDNIKENAANDSTLEKNKKRTASHITYAPSQLVTNILLFYICYLLRAIQLPILLEYFMYYVR
ncbi:hypothetical protein D3C75_1054130 [compost metagenome]